MKHKNISKKVAEYVINLKLHELSQITRYRLAECFGLNKNYLSEKFKKETRMTLSHYLTLEKMRRAELLLRTRPDLAVKDISRMVGYEKCCQFNQKFRDFFLLNPGMYRGVACKLILCIKTRNPRQCTQTV